MSVMHTNYYIYIKPQMEMAQSHNGGKSSPSVNDALQKTNTDENKTTYKRKVFIAHNSRVIACKAKESNVFTRLRIFHEYKERYMKSLFKIRNYKEPKLVHYNRNSYGLEKRMYYR